MKPLNWFICALALTGFLAVTAESPRAEEDEAPKLQSNRDKLRNWKPDEPFDLSGELPTDGKVRSAVYRAQSYLIDQQREDGSWDVELSGEILSNTADDAVDSITATSMSALALRETAHFNPKRCDPVIKKAAGYVMDQVLRGKLSTKVWYAIWRYSFGMRFLMNEYRLTSDEQYKSKLKGVCKRMMDAVLSMQKSNDEAKAYLRSLRSGDDSFPARAGVRLVPPSPNTMTGGARVIYVEKGSSAEEAGIKSGDRIVAIDKTEIENSYDFLLEESDFLGGDRFTLKILRRSEGEEPIKVKLELKENWPPDIGMRLEEGESGLTVRGYWPGSEAREKGIERGALILKVNNEEVKTLADVDAALEGKKIGQRVRIRFQQGEKNRKKTVSVSMAPRQSGWLGIQADDEDKGASIGVAIARVRKNSVADRAGIEDKDRITTINGTPVIGRDHYQSLLATYWEGQVLKLNVTRQVQVDENGKVLTDDDLEKMKEKAAENEEELPEPIFKTEFLKFEVRLSAYLRRGDLQFTMGQRRRGGGKYFVRSVLKGGVADRKRIKVDDELVSINDVLIQGKDDYDAQMRQIFVGDEVKFVFKRGNSKKKVTLEVVDRPPTINDEEGGWAYYFQKPHAPSFVTAAVILNIMEYDETFGDISRRQDKARKNSLKDAIKNLMGLRVYDKEHKVYSYVYDIRGVENPNWINILGNVGRIMVGELAAQQQRKISTGRLSRSLDSFFDYREELDKVRTFPHTHYQKRFNNAAYYWLFGHYYAALAAHQLSDSKRDKAHEKILKAVMLKRNTDGTWYGHEGFGKLCGTAHAMLILGQLKHMSWGQLQKAGQE